MRGNRLAVAEDDQRGEDETGRAEQGVEDGQRPHRQLPAQHEAGQSQAAERPDRENYHRPLQHRFSPKDKLGHMDAPGQLLCQHRGLQTCKRGGAA